MKKENILQEKSYLFAIRVVNLSQYLSKEEKEFVLSKQVLRSGTAIGALTSESKFAQSKADFLNKLMIALKEANETRYWLSLLKDTRYINQSMFDSIDKDANEILSLLISITKTVKSNQ